jgi:hypothetical protein
MAFSICCSEPQYWHFKFWLSASKTIGPAQLAHGKRMTAGELLMCASA